MMNNRLLVGTRKGLFELNPGRGGNWEIGRVWFVGDNVPMLLPDTRDDTLYAALNHGHFGNKLHRLDSGAKQFRECATPAYPARPADRPAMTSAVGSPEPAWSLVLIWSLEAAGPDQKGALWCGTIPGGLFRSEDRGESWELVRSLWDHPQRVLWFGGGMDLPGIHSICVDRRDSKRLAVGVSSGGVWKSNDNGKTWACGGKGMRAEYMPPEKQYDPILQDLHRLVQAPSDPRRMWVQHHNGIFVSSDGSESWTEVTVPPAAPSAFGFAVAVHPSRPDTAWFVPAMKDERRIPVDGKVVVSRTRDGGKSFEVLRDGLPQEHGYDLVYRHSLDVDASGDGLAFGSTCGSLWTSEDGGDHWMRLPHQLPPIYCVRFAT
jgi:hypothetical protein